MAGLLGKFFGFVNRNSATDLGEAQAAFNDRQKRGLETLIRLIGRSIEECVVSLEDQQRRASVLGF